MLLQLSRSGPRWPVLQSKDCIMSQDNAEDGDDFDDNDEIR